MTRRQQITEYTAGPWPRPELMQAVESLADQLVAAGCAMSHAAITGSVYPLYSVSATAAEKDAVRQQLLTWCDWLDHLDRDAEVMDGFRRCGPAPAAADAVS